MGWIAEVRYSGKSVQNGEAGAIGVQSEHRSPAKPAAAGSDTIKFAITALNQAGGAEGAFQVGVTEKRNIISGRIEGVEHVECSRQFKRRGIPGRLGKTLRGNRQNGGKKKSAADAKLPSGK